MDVSNWKQSGEERKRQRRWIGGGCRAWASELIWKDKRKRCECSPISIVNVSSTFLGNFLRSLITISPFSMWLRNVNSSHLKRQKKKKNYKVKGCKKTYDQINPLYKILLSLFSFLVIYEKEFVYFHLLKNMTIFVL